MIGYQDWSRANQTQVMSCGVHFEVIIWMLEERSSMSFWGQCLYRSRVAGGYLFLTHGENFLEDVAKPKEKEPRNEDRAFLSI